MYRDTKLATQLEAKILRPMAYNKQLTKPMLVITVTDGEPTDSPKDKIVDVIQECSRRLHSRGLGPHAVAFQFAQVCEAMHGLCSTQLAPCCFCFKHLHSRIPMCVRPRSSGHFARPTLSPAAHPCSLHSTGNPKHTAWTPAHQASRL